MISLNVASIQFLKRKITQPPFTSQPVYQSTSSQLTTHYYTTILTNHYTNQPLTSNNSQLTTHYYTTIRLHHYTNPPLTTHLSLRVIFDRKLYREVLLNYGINRCLYNIYVLFLFCIAQKRNKKD